MDKFGIFKLLNSFFALNGQNEAVNKAKNDAQNNGDYSQNSLLNAVAQSLSSLKKEQTPAQNQPPKPPANKPLQSSMLDVISKHDDIVKRVKQKNKT